MIASKITPDVPGRGAWTQTGGLLPLRPGHANRAGYYRPPRPGEPMIGAAWATGRDKSHTAQVVHEAVRIIQGLVGAIPDGRFGDETGAAIVKAQRRFGLATDAIAGPATLRALLEPGVARAAAAYDIPLGVLGGVCAHESRLDPGAVGVSGWDHGIAQINLGAAAAAGFSLAQALDPVFALNFTAQGMRGVHDRWAGRTSVDLWAIAVANHNSPRAAQEWAEAGHPPYSAERAAKGYPQIDEYVRLSRAAWMET